MTPGQTRFETRLLGGCWPRAADLTIGPKALRVNVGEIIIPLKPAWFSLGRSGRTPSAYGTSDRDLAVLPSSRGGAK